ncbi:MAG: hypothetical protein OHK0021_04310 [Bryobacter sp.]
MLLPLFLLLAFGPPEFRSQELARDLKGGYQVLPVDLNGDGRTDLIALASGMSKLVWFENPGRAEAEWPRHVLANGFRQMINVAAYQRGPGAIPDLLLAHEFSNNPKQSRGTVSLLEAEAGKSAWKRRDIEDRPTSHRLKLANGKFINAPLAAPESTAPNYEGTVPLVEYDPGKLPGTLASRIVTAAEKGVWHGLSIGDFNHDGLEDIFTAAFNGIAVYVAQRDGNYERIALDAGSRAAWPKSGASEIAQVRLNRKRRPDFVLATIEPWHGNELVVLERQGKQWKRTVLDNTFEEGHALVAADFDGDGQDEILYGARKGGGALRLAWRDKAKGTWKIEKLAEGKIAVNSCATLDADGDGHLDFACIGGATQNLVLYRNTREK